VASTNVRGKIEELNESTLAPVINGSLNGSIYEWTPAGNWRELPDSQSASPNGILVSPDSRTIYFSEVGVASLIRLNRIGSPEKARVPIGRIDNLRWSNDGKILAAYLGGSIISMFRDCLMLYPGACGQEFAVLELDPATLEWTELIRHKGPPIGLVTSAVRIGNRLYLGTAMGDRLAYVDLKDL
jgi:hypothetical protein